MTERLELHPKQGDAFYSENKVNICIAGKQGGKSTVGALWLLRQMSKWNGKDNNFLITAPTYKILNQSTIPSFLKYASQFGEYKKSDQEFKIINGGTIFIRTGTDPDSIEGIPNVRAVWADESGKYKYRFWVNIEGRAARTKAPIILTTTPYSMNWIYSDLIKPMLSGVRDDVSLFKWRSVDNPSFPEAEYERQRRILDAVTFAMHFDGEFRRRVGLVFPIEDGHVIKPMEMPGGTRYYAGLDWGFTNPMALVIRGITTDGRDVQVSEFYESGIMPDDIKQLIRQKVESFGIKKILADPSDPGKIAMLQKAGLPVEPADNDFSSGRDAHIQIMRSGRYSIFNTCKHTIDEYETYSYEDEDEDESDKSEKAQSGEDHAMDANRYLSLWLVTNGIHGFDRPRVSGIDLAPKDEVSPITHKPAWLRKTKKSYGPEYY